VQDVGGALFDVATGNDFGLALQKPGEIVYGLGDRPFGRIAENHQPRQGLS